MPKRLRAELEASNEADASCSRCRRDPRITPIAVTCGAWGWTSCLSW